MDGSQSLVLLFVGMMFVLPIVAIIGGITAGILKTRGQQRIIELAQRERIAAIEKGIDPANLPPLPTLGGDLTAMSLTPRQADLRRAQGLLGAGLVLLAVGLGLSVMLVFLPDPDANKAWAAGIIPTFIGLAFLVVSAVVRRGAPPA
jgi:predicted acyltransferase